MTGTGTQTDPYIVMNVDEFIEAASISDETYVKLGADINMDGLINTVTKFKVLDGDGHSFINMTAPPPHSSAQWYMFDTASNMNGSKIKNVKFQSALLNNTRLLLLPNREVYLEDCEFSIKFVHGGGFLAGYSSTTLHMTRCVCDFQAPDDNGASSHIFEPGNTTYIDDSHIHIDIRGAGNNAYLLYTRSQITNSYVTGHLNRGAVFYNAVLRHSFIVVESTESNTKPYPLDNCTSEDISFFDYQLWSGSESISSAANIYRLPTDKCKDVDYLNSIGFYVVPEE